MSKRKNWDELHKEASREVLRWRVKQQICGRCPRRKDRNAGDLL